MLADKGRGETRDAESAAEPPTVGELPPDADRVPQLPPLSAATLGESAPMAVIIIGCAPVTPFIAA